MSSLRTIGTVAAVAAAGLGYLSVVDRQSAAALAVVELDGHLPTPAWGVAVGVAILAFGVSMLAARTQQATRDARPAVRRRAPATQAPGGGRSGLIDRVNALPLPTGARILIDEPAMVSLHLIIEEAPAQRVRRAVGALGTLLAGLPHPPRARVTFKRCPPPETPWHHQVKAVLGEHLGVGDFRVVRGNDTVDVIFTRPDPAWKR